MGSMQQKLKKYLSIFKNKEYTRAFILSLVFVAISMVVDHFAVIYANERASSSVTDIVLSNIRAYDVDLFFIYGPLLFTLIMVIISLWHTKRLPFALLSVGLFTIIRSAFISLTHLGPFPTQAVVESSNIVSRFFIGNDLFFSGHTGMPFLLALIFWDIVPVRIMCILFSIFFGIIVLLGHYHYSIDVLSAFFITYTIYHIALYLFKKERALF